MHAFVYISQETQRFETDDLERLLVSAQEFNRTSGVTGYLHYEGGYFLQYIEGAEEAIDETIQRIVNDARHKLIYRAREQDLTSRKFPDWHMHWEGRVTLTNTDDAITDLSRMLKPFEQLYTHDELREAFALYKVISLDHVLRAISALHGETNEITDMFTNALEQASSPMNTPIEGEGFWAQDRGDMRPQGGQISEHVKAPLERMRRLVNSVLEQFDVDAQVTIEWVDVDKMVDDLVDRSEQYGEIVKIGDLKGLWTNRLLFWRVLSCLVDNGLTYNQSNAPRVEISARPDDGNWRFCVKDNGIGIAPQRQQRIFELFQRLHDENEYEGAGVGLATCRKIVESWRGHIWVSSREGEGAEFYFTHPMLPKAG